MGVEKSYSEAKLQKNGNSIDLYRPPALRNQTHETGSTSISCNNSPIHLCNTMTSRNSNDATTTTPITTQDERSPMALGAGSAVGVGSAGGEQQSRQQHQQQRRERRPDRAVYIPRARRSQTTPPIATTTTVTGTAQQATAAAVALPAAAHDSATATTTLPPPSATTPLHSHSAVSSNNQQLAITTDSTNATSTNATATADSVSTLHSDEADADTRALATICSNNVLSDSSHGKNSTAEQHQQSNKQQQPAKREKKATTANSVHHQRERKERSKRSQSSANEDINIQVASVALPAAPPQTVENIVGKEELQLQQQQQQKQIDKNSCDTQQQQQQQQVQLITEIEAPQSPPPATSSATSAPPTSVDFYGFSGGPHLAAVTMAEATDNVKPILSTEQYTPQATTTTPPPAPTPTSGGKHVKTSTKSKHKQKQHINDVKNKTHDLRIEDLSPAPNAVPPKCDNDEQELKRAAKEINRSNRRIMKQTFVSDVLEIPDKAEDDKQKPLNRSLRDAGESNGTEEDSWETMFDESGECLDPKIMDELTANVGKVKIELPKMDYTAYLAKQAILNDEEFPHVLEVSNFPEEFKNQDLLMVFSQYKESGFDIKWVDDTHALAVFSSSRIAAEVLTMGHPFVVLKPLAEATVESRNKAKKCASSLQPYRPRPETCAALARRLVTGALGVRLKTAAAERENEKRVLREAKERKLLAAKQRDEIWES